MLNSFFPFVIKNCSWYTMKHDNTCEFIIPSQKYQKCKFPHCLFSVRNRLLELLLSRARPDSPTYPYNFIIFLTWLNNVCNVIKIKVLSPYVKFSCHKVAHREFYFLLFNSYLRQTLRGRCGVVGPCSP